MSDGINGYGPPGARYPFQLFVHTTRPTPIGTEITVVLDDLGMTAQFQVSFPPEDNEWSNRFMTVIDPGPPPLRTASVVVPPEHPLVAFRPVDARGQVIEDLCCMYRVIQGDFLAGLLKPAAVQELAPKALPKAGGNAGGAGAGPKPGQPPPKALIDTRNCCLCGNVVSVEQGFKFADLSSETVRAVKLESSLAETFPFICAPCYQQRFGHLGGAMGAQALGSASRIEGAVSELLRIAFRGYFMAILLVNLSERPPNTWALGVAGLAGAFFPVESIPAVLFNVMKNPLVLLFIFFIPVVSIAFLALNYATAPELFTMHGGLWASMGMDRIIWVDRHVLQHSAPGALIGLVIGYTFGFLGADDEPKKK